MSYRHSTMVDSLPSNGKPSNKNDEAWKTNKVRPNNSTEESWKMSSRLRPAQLQEDHRRQSMPVAPVSEHSAMVAAGWNKPLNQESAIQPFNVVYPPEQPVIHQHQYHLQQPQQPLQEPFNIVYPNEQQQPQQPIQPQQVLQEPFNYVYPQETFQEPYNVVFHPPEHYTTHYHSSPALNTNFTPYTDEYSAEYPPVNDYTSHEYVPPLVHSQSLPPPPPPPQQQQSFHEPQPQQQHPQHPQRPQHPQCQEPVKEEEKKKNSDIKSDERVGRITVQSVNSEYVVWINILPNDTGNILAERIRNIATMRTKKIVSITSHSGRKIPLDNRPIFGNWMEVSSFKDGERWQVEWRDNDHSVLDRFLSKLF